MLALDTLTANISGPYQPGWNSLDRWSVPEWFQDAKFGIYYHWGVYSVPAFLNEWYPHWMYLPKYPQYKYHVANYGPVSRFGYKDFIPMFRAEDWDPDAWVSLFIEAGAKYMGPVAEHADGFSMWKSRVNRWNAFDMGPKRDLVGDMERAVRKRGMKFFTSFHHQWLWGWYESPIRNADIYDPKYADFYWPTPYVRTSKRGAFNYEHPDPAPTKRFSEIWRDKVIEVVNAYSPDLIYFDSRCRIIPEQYREQMLAHYLNHAAQHHQEVAITYKGKDFAEGSGILDHEAGTLPTTARYPWQADHIMYWNRSWCYTRLLDYKPAEWFIFQLIDIVSKNGNFLLDVGPEANGVIPEAAKVRLRAIGSWLKVNGESIYGTRPWSVTFGEGPALFTLGSAGANHHTTDPVAREIRFTTKAEALYIIVMGWPGTSLHIQSIRKGVPLPSGSIHTVSMLGSNARIHWQLSDNGLMLSLPERHPGKIAWAFKLT